MAELKPCPFCGNRTAPEVTSMAELESVEGNEWYDSHFTVVCSLYSGGCGASVRCNNESREEAAEAWNRRSDDNTEDNIAEWIDKEVRGSMTNVCSACGSCSVYPDKYCGGCGRSMKNGY